MFGRIIGLLTKKRNQIENEGSWRDGMFSAYLEELEQELLKKYKPAGKGTAAKKGKDKGEFAYPELATAIDGMTPPALSLSNGTIIDPTGYSPAPADITIYRKYVKNMDGIFSGKIPFELVSSTIHVAPMLDRKNLLEKLVDIAHVKKSGRFGENVEENNDFIASFVMSFDSSYTMDELKKNVIEIYNEQDVGPEYEIDIIAVLGKGVLVKNWREHRSFVALETGKDTLKWFFILMSEYLEVEKNKALDLRGYVKEQTHYKEY